MTAWVIVQQGTRVLVADFVYMSRAQADLVAAENAARIGVPVSAMAVGIIPAEVPPLPVPPAA